jgi:replication factor C small subunit
MKELWVEKYRPKSLKEYVFKDDKQKAQIQNWIKEKALPHLLFSGAPGVGKTTLAKVLFNELEVNDADILEINASRENSIDTVREKIVNFVQIMPWGEFRYVLLDEADYISPNGQAALRGVMEEYHTTARFVLTCNYPNKVIPALHSRCQGFHIDTIDKTEFTARVAEILLSEKVDMNIDVLDTFVKATYPDLRKCINMVQMNSSDGVLQEIKDEVIEANDYKVQMVQLFKEGKILEARKLVCAKARPDEIEDVYRWMYDNLDIVAKTEEEQDKAILVIKQGLVDHSFVADPEINLAATMIKLARIANGQ